MSQINFPTNVYMAVRVHQKWLIQKSTVLWYIQLNVIDLGTETFVYKKIFKIIRQYVSEVRERKRDLVQWAEQRS